jgi:hypothetical protein
MSFRARLEAFERRAKIRQVTHITTTDGVTFIHDEPENRIYIPSDTGLEFHNDNSFVRLVMGPYGSGKSTMCIQEIVRRTRQMPKWSNNRRKARWAVVRNTSGELQSTTLQTWLAWFGGLGDITKRQKPIMTYEHTFTDDDGVCELELIFLALDRPDDVRKVKSLELTGVYLNEMSELPSNVLAHFKGRVNGRYPSKSFCADPYWSGIIADTNPPDQDHHIYRDFESHAVEGYKLFKQPPGLIKDINNDWQQNHDCDNWKHLSNDYYTKLATGQSEDFVKVFCLGQWGVVGTGRRVFPECSDVHIVEHIDAAQGEDLYLGIDFGLTPAVVVMQLTQRGQLLILKEYVGHDIGIKSFMESVVLPGVRKTFPYSKIGKVLVDPAGTHRSQVIEEMSCLGELLEMGLDAHAAQTNALDPRLSAVRYFLNAMVDGKPRLQISRADCPVVVKGFLRDYVYRRLAVSGEERFKSEPDKNYASHCFVADTLVVTPKGLVPISELKVGDKVVTPLGSKSIVSTMNREVNELIELSFSNDTKIVCTLDHPFITKNGTIRADALQYSDILYTIKDDDLCEKIFKNTTFNYSKASSTTKRPMVITKLISMLLEPLNTCIEMFGNFITERLPKNIVYITSTTTKVTMTSKTFASLVDQSMLHYTAKKDLQKTLVKCERIWPRLCHWLKHGINPKKELNGTQNMPKSNGRIKKKILSYVQCAKKNINHILRIPRESIAHHIAYQKQGECEKQTMRKDHVASALLNLNAINTQEKKHAPMLVGRKRLSRQEIVYDLTVSDAHCFYANGILVSNCQDAIQYVCLELASTSIVKEKSQDKKIDMFNPVMRTF